ncbi:NADH dehydrogenase I chain E [Buchnera aphidicola str. Bp (Baizongia pistaciae)]|uniref:NADH-quinone oxidoreductase subunit E n=1 Tax=Buchnera aphidicola subsp. Baizongia pistaciae (strain Bp) TaxID=224915 RepID=NUOE_BUCBP|nr:NADH-quinone oxidoreductase subunit NuoE [Buchnera aphidicola]Q89AU3.1 RecName: Full=NADH-quinone oxidoreductase subunit E; AltName: Full=NADH dehydrogenase I subunit E; AltName: Full=NDH-1 subunit E [Buchnera aphidicola str. Bp (Baizongia pistaciae)]AAO26880.1 NADH dehydrogenase I chain E [Buchnera aphidicola str. Bp (Baizongia pistaciae)]
MLTVEVYEMSKKIDIKFKLTIQEKIEIFNIIKNYRTVRSSLIEILKFVQKSYGWISNELITELACILKISKCDIEEIATFYSQIFRQPIGRNIIKYCDSVVCYVNGCEKIRCSLEKNLNVNVGETTKDFKFTLLPICCLGNCDKSPTIMINDDLYSNVTEYSVIVLLESYQ